MEICALNKTVPSYKLLPVQAKQIRETVETVIPDSNNDIIRIAAVSASYELKGKECFGNRVTAEFDLCADIICLPDNCKVPEKVSVRKTVSVEFECDVPVSEKLTHIEFALFNYEARLVNPRKTALMFEGTVKLYTYSEYEFPVSISLPETDEVILHKKPSEHDVQIISVISEKPFVITGQKTVTEVSIEDILSCEEHLAIDETEYIGTKAVIKGRAMLDALCRNADSTEKISMTVPFSQVIDCGIEGACLLEVLPQVNSKYYSVSDSISGGKSLEAEIHALIQYCVFTKTKVGFIDDVYCNTKAVTDEKVPLELCTERVNTKTNVQLSGNLLLPEDCGTNLYIYPEMTHYVYESGVFKAEIGADILYLTQSGELMAVHRTLTDENSVDIKGEINKAHILSANIKDGQAEFAVELECSETRKESLQYISKVIIGEDSDYEQQPGFSIVRLENETVWELAKDYNSSPESILEYNEGELSEGKMILIPKTR